MSSPGYAIGMLTRPRRRGGWTTHLGRIDHYFGAYTQYVWVRTFCGRDGRMPGRLAVKEATRAWVENSALECKTCLRSWEAQT